MSPPDKVTCVSVAEGVAGQSELEKQDHLEEGWVSLNTPLGELSSPKRSRIDFKRLELLDNYVRFDLKRNV